MLKDTDTIELSLRPSRDRVPAEAWFILGRTVSEWLGVMLAQGMDLNQCQAVILPRSLGDRSPAGLMVTEGGDALRGSRSPQIQGYRYQAAGLLVPCDAELYPRCLPDELETLVPYPLAVFHPSIGLVGFEESDRVCLADLLLPWRERSSNFSAAHPGVALQEKLHAITALPVPRVEILLSDVQDEIGSASVDTLPPAPEEPRESGVRRLRNQVRLRFFKAIKKLSKGGQTASSESWRQRLEAWTEDRIEAMRRDQERELKRLLHLLKNDPDEGLKYALPLGGAPSREGLTPPSRSKLRQRPVDFRLEKVNDGRGTSAPWVLDWQKHYELSRQYREAANRELILGRHRRAAYIFAELLKDYREAANVLRQGKHYREASVLYLKHLGDPLEGARCLREGGFLAEAIPIFEKKKQFETVAELHAEMGDLVEAERYYRLAVSRCVAHGQSIKAATLLERQLRDCESAIKLLQQAWPRASDAATCLRHELDLYERHRQWDRFEKRLDGLVAEHPASCALGLMETLVKVSRQTSHGPVRERASSGAFTVAGRWLGSPSYPDRRGLLDLVRRLVPEDRLLIRDTARFQQQCERAVRERQRCLQAPGDREDPLVFLDVRPLPDWVQWQLVEPWDHSGLVALGVASHGTTLMRLRWDGAFQTLRLPVEVTPDDRLGRCQLEIATGALPEVVSVLGMRLPQPSLMEPGDAFDSSLRVENPPWVEGEDFLGMTYGGKGVAWVLRRHGDDEGLLVIASYSSLGDLIATHTVRLPFVVDDACLRAPLPMVYACEQIVFVCGQHLVRFYRDRVDSLKLSAEPLRLHAASVHGKLSLAVSYEIGGEVLFGSSQWGRRRLLDNPVDDPVITFTRTGDVLMASDGRLELMAYQDGEYRLLQSESVEGLGRPLAVCRTETSNLYALIGRQELRRVRVNPLRRPTT